MPRQSEEKMNTGYSERMLLATSLETTGSSPVRDMDDPISFSRNLCRGVYAAQHLYGIYAGKGTVRRGGIIQYDSMYQGRRPCIRDDNAYGSFHRQSG
jgi:hypothetical protein